MIEKNPQPNLQPFIYQNANSQDGFNILSTQSNFSHYTFYLRACRKFFFELKRIN